MKLFLHKKSAFLRPIPTSAAKHCEADGCEVKTGLNDTSAQSAAAPSFVFVSENAADTDVVPQLGRLGRSSHNRDRPFGIGVGNNPIRPLNPRLPWDFLQISGACFAG
jgi:hypothetical protein